MLMLGHQNAVNNHNINTAKITLQKCGEILIFGKDNFKPESNSGKS